MKISQYFLRYFNQLPLITALALLSACATNDKQASFTSSQKIQSGSNEAVKEALQLQGHPYVYGGESPSEGFDCSGLVFYVYKKQGVKLPRDTWSLASQLPSVQLDQRMPGDLVFFTMNTKPLSHVGIYIGQDKFIHAPSERTGRVMLSNLNQPYWRERFAAVRRPQLYKSLSANDKDHTLW